MSFTSFRILGEVERFKGSWDILLLENRYIKNFTGLLNQKLLEINSESDEAKNFCENTFHSLIHFICIRNTVLNSNNY